MSSHKFIISGGGTGGHIFPAIAIANALKADDAGHEILFVGANGRMEMEKVPKAGYKIVGLNIMGIQRKLTLKNLLVPFKLLGSMMKAKKILKEFKPDAVVGVGGYASGPLLKVATNNAVPALIQEQNSYPGITNKLLAKRVNKICVAYDGMEKFFPKEKIVKTGNPVRQQVIELDGKRDDALEFFGLAKDKVTLLVVGGSLGSRTINHSIHAGLEQFTELGMQVIWQTGKQYINEATALVKEKGWGHVKPMQFIDRMDYAYAAADMVVSRAGAMSVSELCLVKKPAFLVPLPIAAEDHQTKNAMSLVDRNAAILVKDEEAKETLSGLVAELAQNETKRKELSDNIAAMALKNSADVIANEVLSLVKQ